MHFNGATEYTGDGVNVHFFHRTTNSLHLGRRRTDNAARYEALISQLKFIYGDLELEIKQNMKFVIQAPSHTMAWLNTYGSASWLAKQLLFIRCE
jgi:hypothetical protein